MHIPETREFYVMDMIDYREVNPDAPPSLDGLITDTYGRQYVGQQTGDMMPNDSYHVYKMDENTIREALDDFEWDGIVEYGGRAQFTDWIDDSTEYKYDFQHYRQAPTPDVALALLIDDGHLPKGDYLIWVSW